MTDTTGVAVRRAVDRDVRRAVTALTTWPWPDPRQRVAIADHLTWMLEPVVRQGSSASAGAADVIAAATRYATDAGCPADLAVALGNFGDGPLPPPAPSAQTPHWLADPARPAGRHRLRGGRGYRARAYRCWYLAQHSPLRRELSTQVGVDVAAPPDAVWRVIADPVRTPEWSHECTAVEFLDGATESRLDVRFRGANRHGGTRWSRVCTIFAFEPDREFGYLTSSAQGDATAWHFHVAPTDSGARLTQAFRIVAMPPWVSLMVALLMPSHGDRSGALLEDMRRVAALAERDHRTGSTA